LRVQGSPHPKRRPISHRSFLAFCYEKQRFPHPFGCGVFRSPYGFSDSR
jgi:hypothetical protein